MDDEKEWDRREEDRKARQDLTRAIEKLEGRIETRLENLAERVNELDEFLRGGTTGEDPLGTRVHLVETGLTELRVLVKGDALGRGSLVELTKKALADAEDAKKIAQGKVETETTRRGQNVSFWIATVTTIGLLLTGFRDEIRTFFRSESPEKALERVQKDIENAKKKRGPAVNAKLKEIEESARRLRRGY